MPLDIKRNLDYYQNESRTSEGAPCVVCGRRIVNPTNYVHLYYGSMAVTEEEALQFAANDRSCGGDLGHYPIGADCLKKHPEIKPYLVED